VAEPLRVRGFAGGDALVLGAGGAARAAVLALESLGATSHIAARSVESGRSLLAELCPARAGRAVAFGTPAELAALLPAAGAIIQADTGGTRRPGSTLDWSLVPSGCIAFDMLYRPRRTAFLESAAGRGLPDQSRVGDATDAGSARLRVSGRAARAAVEVMRRALLGALG